MSVSNVPADLRPSVLWHCNEESSYCLNHFLAGNSTNQKHELKSSINSNSLKKGGLKASGALS